MTEMIYVTKEGLDRLKAELASMKTERMRIAEPSGHARDLGALSEHAGSHAAKEATSNPNPPSRAHHAKARRRRRTDGKEIDSDKAYIGSSVRVLNKNTQKEVTYQLVSPVEADMAAGKISTKSPVGQALLGKSIGETVVAKIPAGDLQLEILEISR